MTNEPARVHRRADDPVAGGLLDRQRLAGEHRLVHRGRAVDDDAIDGNAIARAARARGRRRRPGSSGHLALAARAQDARGRAVAARRSASHGAGGLALGACLEPSAEQDEADDHGGGVEVGLVPEPGGHHRVRQERDEDRVGVGGHACRSRRGCSCSPRRGGRRVTAATRNRRPKTNWTIVAGMRNQRLTSIIGHGVPPGQNMIAIITPPMTSDASAWKRSSRRSAARSSLGGIDVGGCVRGGVAARRRSRRPRWPRRSRAVDDRGIEAHGGALGGEVDGRVADAIGALRIALDAVDAARAGHADDGQR